MMMQRLMFLARHQATAGCVSKYLSSHRPLPTSRKFIRQSNRGADYRTRAAVAGRLACPPPTKANRAQSSAGSFPEFRMWGIVPDDAAGRRVLSRDLTFPSPFHSGAAPYSPQLPSSALKISHLRAAQISPLTNYRISGVFVHDAECENGIEKVVDSMLPGCTWKKEKREWGFFTIHVPGSPWIVSILKEVSLEQHRNAREGKTGDPRRNPQISTIPACENPGATPSGIEPGSPGWECSVQVSSFLLLSNMSQFTACSIEAFEDLLPLPIDISSNDYDFEMFDASGAREKRTKALNS
ncbi:hypothetical protein PR048_019432 [Dryococelus australis]|uniref:Uncharacterized protein n=1 Tax=Dryococelus australis TaxID=614101 RepID=A0ABQ9H3V0_9NEOP|nr:hypothetical protein PR048_019432 [Dryococelus australis]